MCTAFQEGPSSVLRRLDVSSKGESSSRPDPYVHGAGGEKQEPSSYDSVGLKDEASVYEKCVQLGGTPCLWVQNGKRVLQVAKARLVSKKVNSLSSTSNGQRENDSDANGMDLVQADISPHRKVLGKSYVQQKYVYIGVAIVGVYRRVRFLDFVVSTRT